MMTDLEIKSNWRKSSKDAAQVKILAELNGVSVDFMQGKLDDLGLTVVSRKGQRKPGQTQPPMSLEFECCSPHDNPEPLTVSQLAAILSTIAEEHPDSLVTYGKRGTQIESIALLNRYTAEGSTCLAIRLI